MEFLSVAVDKLWNYTVVPIAKQAGYLIFYSRNVNELTEEVAALQLAKERVQHEVDAALRNGERIEQDVQKWLEEVNEISLKSDELNNDECHAKAGCSSRSFPNIYYRHKLSRQSKKIKDTIVEIKKGGSFDRVSYREVPQLILEDHTQLGSRVSLRNDVMKALEDPMVYTIGVYGLGGGGKTTLAKEVAKKAEQDKLFDVVAWADVTRNLDIGRIQNQIADRLGLKFEETSLNGKAYRLRDRLDMKRERVLIILDDLWKELNMGDVGIPPAHNGLKIVMTSRSQELLSDRMKAQRNFFLNMLTKEEARKLFFDAAQFDESVASDEFMSIATQVSDECAALPIAIVTVASALRNKKLPEWKAILRQLKDPALANITDIQDEVYKSIKASYDALENDFMQSIFLLCGVMQSNSLVMDLVKNSIGLDLFGICTLDEARDSLYRCIRKLKDSCLLLDSYSPNYFGIHDVVQDVATFLASRQQPLFRCKSLEEWPEGDQLINCRTIILDDCDFDELPDGLNYPSLRYFHLYHENAYLEIADRFFEGMPELRVLNLEGEELDCLPSSIRLLSKLRTLRLNLDVLGDLGIIGELKSLRVLTLSSDTMTQLPLELSQLTQLQLLDLRDCEQLELIPSNLLSGLTKLEELYLPTETDTWLDFAQCHVDDPNYEQLLFAKHHGEEVLDSASDRRNQQSRVSLAELKNLARLTTLEVRICDENMLPKDVVFERLKSYKIIIVSRSNDHWISKDETSRQLQLDLNTSIHSWDNLKRLFYTVEYLCLYNLKGAENVIPGMNEEGMQKLKWLELDTSDDIQTIVDSSGWDLAVDIFPNLESLT